MITETRRARRDRIGRAHIGATIAIGAVTVLALRSAGMRINLSPSVPVGIYLAERIRSDRLVHRGSLVAVCLPADVAEWGRARGYLHRGSCADGTAPVGKPVFAVAGDTVTVRATGLRLNRDAIARTQPLRTDDHARPLPRVPDGRYVVHTGDVWLVSTYSTRSWDSRYFGAVPATAIVSLLRPIWVAGGRAP